MPSHESAADAPKPGLPSEGQSPTMSQLLASCAAATAVSTPPDGRDSRTAGDSPAAAEVTAADILAAPAPTAGEASPPETRSRPDAA